MVVFLNALAAAPKPLSHAKIKALDSVYGCSKSGNCEIKCAFFIIALKYVNVLVLLEARLWLVSYNIYFPTFSNYKENPTAEIK